MKKIILILLSLICITSCYKNISDEQYLRYGSFYDEINLNDSTSYYMSCNIVPDEVEMYFVKKERYTISIERVAIIDTVYYVKKYSSDISREVYKYDHKEFRELMIEKNKLPRDTTIFKFTPNMYCSWKVFDKIYNTSIKHE